MKKTTLAILLGTMMVLAAIPMTSMAEKGGIGAGKATPSNLVEDTEEEILEEEDTEETYVEEGVSEEAKALEEQVVVSESGSKDGKVVEKDEEAVKEESDDKEEVKADDEAKTDDEAKEKEEAKEKDEAKEKEEAKKQEAVKKADITAEDIAGSWTVDGVTDLQFKEDKSGALIVPSKKFAFTWSLEEDQLSLSFEDGAARDTVYTVAKGEDGLSITENGKTILLKGLK
jgi:DNA primase large subunit